MERACICGATENIHQGRVPVNDNGDLPWVCDVGNDGACVERTRKTRPDLFRN